MELIKYFLLLNYIKKIIYEFITLLKNYNLLLI